MLLSLCSLLLAAAASTLLLSTAAKRFSQYTPSSLLVGVGSALSVPLLSISTGSIHRFGWGLSDAALISVAACASICVIGVARLMIASTKTAGPETDAGVSSRLVSPSLTAIPYRLLQSPLRGALILLIAVHIILVLQINASQPIFPWDAFTTWMYRSKAWVMNDSLLPISGVTAWLSSGGDGYVIHADHYPNVLSVWAASLSSLHNSWQSDAASAGWGFLLATMALTFAGTLRFAGAGTTTTLAGTYALISMPLMVAHAALAGYADLAATLFSGCGLALLLAARDAKKSIGTVLGLCLLAVGTQIKLEGWLWLGMGSTFLLCEWAANKFGYRWLLVGVALAAAIGVPLLGQGSALSLGALGTWGVTDDMIKVGVLGHYPIRPYNPLYNYWAALFHHPNFHLLLALYLPALLLLSTRKRRQALGHWIMLTLIVLSQGIIFGLSSFSEYAQIGTAINRLLLHFMPVFVYTLVATVQGLQWHRVENGDHDQGVTSAVPAAAGVIVAVIALLLAVGLSTNWPSSNDKHDYAIEAFTPVLGTAVMTEDGLQFESSPADIGVVKAPLDKALSPVAQRQTPVMLVGVETLRRDHIGLYWINQSDPGTVIRRALPDYGPPLVDLRDDPDWGNDNIIELGVMVNKSVFHNSYLRGLERSSGPGLARLSLAFDQWWARGEPSQQSLNRLDEPRGEWPGLHRLLNAVALVFGLLLAVTSIWQKPWGAKPAIMAVLAWGIATLWLVADSRLILTLHSWWQTATSVDLRTSTGAAHAGLHIKPTATALQAILDRDTPAVVVPAEANLSFEAQRLTYELLPQRSLFLRTIAPLSAHNWTGYVIVYGPEQLSDKLKTSLTGFLFVSRAENAWIFRGPVVP